MRVPVAFELFWSDQHYIYGLSNSMQIDVNIPQHTTLVKLAAFHYEQIHVAVRSHLFPRGGPKKNDPLWLRHRHDALNDLCEYFRSDLGHRCNLRASPAVTVPEQRKDSTKFLVDTIAYSKQSKS